MRTCRLMFIVVLMSPWLAMAQPLADKLPNDTLAYFGWRGADSMGPGYNGSHLKAVLDASDFSQLVDEFLPQVMQKLGQSDRGAVEFIPVVSEILKANWKHSSAFYFGGVEVVKDNPNPRLAWICEAGADAPQLLATLQNLVAKAQGAPFPIEVKQSGSLVVWTLGKMSHEFDAAIGGDRKSSLIEEKGFKAAMEQVVKDPSFTLYINVEGILEGVGQIINQEPDSSKAKQIFPKIRDGLGLAGLKRIVYAGGFDGKDWMEGAFVAAPSPRTGLLKLVDGGPLSADLLKVVPKTATQVGAGRFNLAGLIGQIRDGVTQFDPNAGAQVDAALAQASQMLGMDIQKDLFGALGDEWVGYADPNTGGYGFAGTVLVNRLADPAKAEQSFSHLEQFINQMVAPLLQREKMSISFQTRKAGDLTLHYLAVPLVTPTWAVKDGNLYVALYPQAVIGAAEFVTGKGPSILENEEFLTVRKRLGETNAGGIQFTDLARLAPINYGSWVAISRLIGFADLFGIKSPILMLPPLNVLMANLGPAGGVSWSDDLGLHMKTICPFPGSTLFGADPISAYMTSAVPALSMGVLLPATAKARESANRVKSMSNLRQIGMACMLYANENNGKYPPDLGTLLKTQDIVAAAFISPRGRGEVPAEVRAMKAEQQAEWINQNADYVYLGKGKNNTMHADEVLAYEKLEIGGRQGSNFLYGDGHVEWLQGFMAQDMVSKLNGAK